MKSNKIIVIAGPSGVGKDTVIREVMNKFKSDQVTKLVSATTRPMRRGEINGKMYYFLSVEEFKNNIKKGLIPEYNKHAGNYYGIYLPDLKKKIDQNKIIFVQVQLVGAQYLKKEYGALTIFLKTASLEVLKERIKSRGSVSKKEAEERIQIAKQEIKEESKFYDYIVINKQGELDQTVQKVLKIIKNYLEDKENNAKHSS